MPHQIIMNDMLGMSRNCDWHDFDNNLYNICGVALAKINQLLILTLLLWCCCWNVPACKKKDAMSSTVSLPVSLSLSAPEQSSRKESSREQLLK